MLISCPMSLIGKIWGQESWVIRHLRSSGGLWKLVISLNEKVDVILAQMERKEDFEYISKASGRSQSEC